MYEKNIFSQNLLFDCMHSFIQTVATDGGKPVCVAICDKHGFLCLFTRMENAPARCIAIAKAKAYTAAIMECRTSDFHARLQAEKHNCRDFCDSEFTTLAGGVPLNICGKIAGAIGVSGRKTEEDEMLAQMLANMIQTAWALPQRGISLETNKNC